jgi:hypothetical protein
VIVTIVYFRHASHASNVAFADRREHPDDPTQRANVRTATPLILESGDPRINGC